MFARREAGTPAVFDLNAVAAGMVRMLDRVLGARVAAETRLAPAALPLGMDPNRLEQVVMNLAVNARDAMPDGGTLTIRTEAAADGRAARQVVSDTGVGMTDAVKARNFEPFFTTKGVGKGTGLGLATVYGIVEDAGGAIEVASAPAAGAEFAVTLPLSLQPLPAPPPAAGRGVSVLLAEDEDGVRNFARCVLEGVGYAVAAAADGEAALRLLDPARGPDVLVTDVSMPGIQGPELANRVRAAHPGVRVLFITGYAPDATRFAGVPNAAVLPKPFAPAALLDAVRVPHAGG